MIKPYVFKKKKSYSKILGQKVKSWRRCPQTWDIFLAGGKLLSHTFRVHEDQPRLENSLEEI